MKRLLSILLLLSLLSCGDDPVKTEANCSTDVNAIKSTWTSDNTGITYDASACSPYTTCRFCFHFSCNGTQDFDLVYTPEGNATITYLFYSSTITGNWQVCDGKLELYNLSDGSNPETFR